MPAFPLPRSYQPDRGFVELARPLLALTGVPVASAMHVTTRSEAVNYARAGYHAARRKAESERRTEWNRVAQYYAFVHDLDAWLRLWLEADSDERRIVDDLRWKLRFADAESSRVQSLPPLGLLGSPVYSLGRVTSGWGEPRPYRNGIHEGLDFLVPIGTPIYAMDSGTVLRAPTDPCADASGVHATVQGDDDSYDIVYMHLSRVDVVRGQHVLRGQQLGLSGRTGGGRDGPGCTFSMDEPHLHVTIRAHRRITRRLRRALRGTERGGKIAVPGEPLVPALYDPRVVRRASEYRFALAPGSRVA